MKKKFVVLVSALMILCSSVAFADDDSFKTTISLKAWDNSWTEKDTPDYGSSSTYNWGSALMVGPSLNLKFGKGFAGVTYMQSASDYEATDLGLKTKRTDLDVVLGVKFVPYFGMFVGYKTLNADFTDSVTGDALATWKLKGPGIGLLGNIPLGSVAALYGNVAYMRMSQELSYAGGGTSSSLSYDLNGFSGELGVAFAFSEMFSANVGYKAQSFSGSDDYGTYDYTFKGLTLGLNLTF